MAQGCDRGGRQVVYANHRLTHRSFDEEVNYQEKIGKQRYNSCDKGEVKR